MACKKFVIFMCVFFQVYCQSSKEVVVMVETFFSNLMKKYEASVLTNETRKLIDYEIDEFVNSTLKNLHIPRYRKQLPNHSVEKRGVEVFDNLDEVLTINASNVRDLYFFKKHNQYFSIAITSTDLIVYKNHDTQVFPVVLHPVPDFSELQVCKFLGTTWFIVKHAQGFTILHFFLFHEQFTIDKVQSIDITDIKHFSVWRDRTQMFLSVSSASAFHVYLWFDGTFKLVELLPVTAYSSAFFAIEESVNLVVLENRKTTILKYAPNALRFDGSQSISKSFNNVATMQISNDYFLVLSNRQRTVLYKLSDNIFVPFQEIAPADRVISIVRNATMVLFLMKDGSLSVYQYDGWRFIRLNYELGGIEILKSIAWRGGEHLIIKKIDVNWILMRLRWSRAKVPSEHGKSLRQWCVAATDQAKKMPKFMSDRKLIELLNVNLQKITVGNVNGISAEKLKKLNDSYNDLFSRLQAASELYKQKRTLVNPTFSTLQAKIINVNCSGNCHVNNLMTELPFDITSRLRRIDDETLSLKFEEVHIDTLEGFPCPAIGLKLEDVTVKGLINGVSFDDIYKNALRTSGNQVVTANHEFEELHVYSLIAPNIEAASTYTRQRFKTQAIYAKELSLTDGGLLLPLDGEPVTMTGTLTAKKAMFNKLVDQRGGITGKSIKKFAPMVSFGDYHKLTGNYTLGNVKIMDLLETNDIARRSGKSLKEIVDKAIPLDGDVPVHLEFFADRTIWSNITVENLPNWLTRKNAHMVTVTGTKIALKNITLPDDIYSQLPLPKIETPACSVVAITPNLRTSSIHVGRATAKTVVVDDIEGAKDLESLLNDCVTSLDEVDLSKKVFTGRVLVENLNVISFEGSPFESFDSAMFKWYEPHVLKGPITLKNLNVSSVNAAEGIRVPIPSEIQSLSVKGNIQVKTLNGINLDDFFKNIVRINESIVLNNIIFEGSVEVGEINAINTNIDLQVAEPSIFLGNKTIIGDLIVEGDFSIANDDALPFSDKHTTYVIDGSVRFKKEPEVVNINGKNVQELMSSIWMLDRPAILKGNYHMKNVTLSHLFDSYDLLSTPNFGPWATVENQLLSKTKLQEIPSTLYFKNAKIPNIITRGNSVLNSSDPYLNDLLYMTLKKNESCTISDKWRFEELIITGDLKLDGKINNLNLSSDVARHDVKINVFTGNKTVKGLTVKYLHGLNFEEWAKDALMQSGMKEPVIITGKKTFNNLHARLLKVSGTVMGKKIEKCLTKYGDQVITAPKMIKGSLHIRSLSVKGLINGMNFTDVVLNQLTRNASLQTFNSNVTFIGNLHILGNLTIKSLQDVEIQSADMINENFMPLIDAIDYLTPYAVALETAKNNRAKFWNKFEEIQGQLLPPFNDDSPPVILTFHRLGNCMLVSVYDLECNGQDKYYLKPFANASTMIINEILSVDNVPLVVQVSSGSRSRITIYQYNYRANSFVVTQSVRVPGITAASVLCHQNIVWIVTLLDSQMLVLRYETWGDFRKYYLPPSSLFVLDRVQATDEPILVRDDGMWKLDGLAGPRHAFKADLICKNIESFHVNGDFFIRLIYRDKETTLLKTKYVGV